MAEPLELKKTLNLPKTDFPMKANLPQNEPKQLAAWQDENLYERILEVRKGKPLFVLHDGPPYPTGEIHLGTGLNKILKDLVVRTRSMAGHYAPYVPGWDCHGLPIETQVEKELGGKGKVPPAEFRKLCRQFATRYVEQHKKDFKRLGILNLSCAARRSAWRIAGKAFGIQPVELFPFRQALFPLAFRWAGRGSPIRARTGRNALPCSWSGRPNL